LLTFSVANSMKRSVVWTVAGLARAGGAVGGLAWLGAGQVIRRRVPDTIDSPDRYGLTFEDVAFTATDGVRLGGWFIPAEPARGTVVFCHGHAGSMDPDLQYAPWFHAAGYNLLLFDFRGHGRSGGNRVSMGYLERRDLMGAVNHLATRGIDRVGVMGFSMGGAVGMATAPHCRTIHAVVSDSGFAELATAIAGGVRERFCGATTEGSPLCVRGLNRVLARLIVWLAGRRLGLDLASADPIRWVDRLAPAGLLLIVGGRDPYVSIEDTRRLYVRASGPKELWVVPEAGHRQIDACQPDEYRQRVLAFFDRYLIAA
jgi:fermentation-respiration switch protein FrsA (DUF1100 family)